MNERLGNTISAARKMASERPSGLSQTYEAVYRRNRRATDPRFNAEHHQRCFFAAMLNSIKSSPQRIERFRRMTGLTPAEMRAHIESQFELGMSWENRRAWHIDHKQPCCSFDLTDSAQARKCWHWKNLRPLPTAQNRSKIRYDLTQLRPATASASS